MKKIINFLLILYYLFSFSVVALEYNPKTGLEFDPEIETGKLENGLTYFVYENKKPKGVAYLRLVIKAGSLQEDDDQQGLAHFVEHMAFNGSKNFDAGEIINFMESIGMEYGPHLNASTGYEKTIYKLKILTNDQQILEKSMVILSDFAAEVSFNEEAFENERKVIVEEWRQSLGPSKRQADKVREVIFANSKYADRKPIGKMEIIKTFDSQRARDFYHEWYRPELMAIIAIGDFEKVNIVKLIKKQFSNLSNPKKARKKENHKVPIALTDSVHYFYDPEETKTVVQIFFNNEPYSYKVQDDFRKDIISHMFINLLNDRLNEISLQNDPPFVVGVIFNDEITPQNTNFTLAYMPINNEFDKGFLSILSEVERIRQYGFLKSELERIKNDFLSYNKKKYDNRNELESSYFIKDFIDRFLRNEAITSIAYDYELLKAILPTITTDDLLNYTNEWYKESGRQIILRGPEKDRDKFPTEETILALLNTPSKNQLSKYQEKDLTSKPLLEMTPTPSKVVYEKYYKKIDATEWKLANGIRVVLKPTKFKENDIIFAARSPGGTSLMDDEFFVSANRAVEVVDYNGIGNFDAIELGKKLSGKNLSIYPNISYLTEGIKGSSTNEDLPTLFELIYLYFTEPRYDEEGFLNYLNREKELLLNKKLEPKEAFSDLVTSKLYDDHYRARTWSIELLEEIDYNQAFNFYQERFADGNDFTFYFVGSFELEEIKPLIETYLGGLPIEDKKEHWKDRDVNYFTGKKSEVLRMGKEPKNLTYLIYTGPFYYHIKNRLDFTVIGKMLDIRLKEIVREKIGGVYSIGSYGWTSKYPDSDYAFIISFSCDPERREEIIATINEEILNLQETGIGQVYLDKINKQLLQDYREKLETNNFWLDTLKFYDWIHEPYANIFYIEKLHTNRKLADIKRIAKKLLVKKNYMQLSHLPE